MTLSSFLGRVGPIPVAAGLMIWFSLAVALAEGRPLLEAARFANAAAAISVARFGAQSSIPFREEIDDFVARQGKFTPANRMRA